MSYIVKPIGEKVTLAALLTKDGTGITGLSPTVEVRRNVDGFYLDFSASSAPFWKTTGGTKEKVLVERSWLPGYYTWVFDQGYYDNTKKDYTVIYRNPAPYRLLQIEIISFNNEAAWDISFIKKMLANKQVLEALASDHFIHTVFDDDEVSELHKADIRITGNIETRQPL